ncbi:MAG: zinc metalloprotease HtpX [Myxococcota bacterium]
MTHRIRKLAHRGLNQLQTIGLIAILAIQTALVGFLVAGGVGAGFALVMGFVFAAGAARMPGWAALRMLGARPLPAWQAPWLNRVVDALSRRAELPKVPQLALIESPELNAMTVGSPDEPVVAVTRGLLRQLPDREIVGVLAHEISHIAHRDLRTLALAQAFASVTARMGPVGLFLVPLGILFGAPSLAWVGLALLSGPLLAQLLTLAVSRQREFAADDLAVELTGDPEGLATALHRIEQTGRRRARRLGVMAEDAPVWLRSHPATHDRITRLGAT